MRARIDAQKFLLIEDNPALTALLRQLLPSLGARNVRAVSDPRAARAAIEAEQPDIVITDLEMEPVSGVDLTRWIRRGKDSPKRTLAVLMTTAHTDPAKVLAARDAGVDEFLVKPLDVKRLNAKIDAVLQRRRPFVKDASYIGPCRRRGTPAGYDGPFRRQDDQAGEVEELAI